MVERSDVDHHRIGSRTFNPSFNTPRRSLASFFGRRLLLAIASNLSLAHVSFLLAAPYVPSVGKLRSP
jgi:hypothetical protein